MILLFLFISSLGTQRPLSCGQFCILIPCNGMHNIIRLGQSNLNDSTQTLTALNSWDFLKKESRIFYEFLIGMLH